MPHEHALLRSDLPQSHQAERFPVWTLVCATAETARTDLDGASEPRALDVLSREGWTCLGVHERRGSYLTTYLLARSLPITTEYATLLQQPSASDDWHLLIPDVLRFSERASNRPS